MNSIILQQDQQVTLELCLKDTDAPTDNIYMKKSTKGHNSVKFGRSKNSFLYFHLHIKVLHPWKFKQNLPFGLRGVAFTKFLYGI
jgi:hypothetical protein